MKYFTKDWYNLCGKMYIQSLEHSKKAKTFSEKYFQKLYKQKLMDWLELEKEMSSHTFDDISSPELYCENLDDMSEEDIDRLKQNYLAQREIVKANYTPRTYDEKKSTEDFFEIFINNQQRIIKTLPDEILKDIADIRVFALGQATKQVIQKTENFCKQNAILVNKVFKDYDDYYKEASELFDEDIVENMGFHDCNIKSVRPNEQYLVISLDNSGGFTNVNEILFENYKIIKQDGVLENAWWLYEETYMADNVYEIHVLLQNNDNKLIDFIVSAEKIRFSHDNID